MTKAFSFDTLNTNCIAHRQAAMILRLRRVEGLSTVALPERAGRDAGAALLARYGFGQIVTPSRFTDDATQRFAFT